MERVTEMPARGGDGTFLAGRHSLFAHDLCSRLPVPILCLLKAEPQLGLGLPPTPFSALPSWGVAGACAHLLPPNAVL